MLMSSIGEIFWLKKFFQRTFVFLTVLRIMFIGFIELFYSQDFSISTMPQIAWNHIETIWSLKDLFAEGVVTGSVFDIYRLLFVDPLLYLSFISLSLSFLVRMRCKSFALRYSLRPKNATNMIMKNLSNRTLWLTSQKAGLGCCWEARPLPCL